MRASGSPCGRYAATRFFARDKYARTAERSLRVKSTQNSNRCMATERKIGMSRQFRRTIKSPSPFEMAGARSRHSLATASVIRAAGNFFRTASIAGVVKIRSPIRFSWSSKMFTVAQGSACVSLAKHPSLRLACGFPRERSARPPISATIERCLSAGCLCLIARRISAEDSGPTIYAYEH